MDEAIPYMISIKSFADKSGKINWINGNQLWIQMYPYDTWTHPVYTDTTINEDIASKMVQNFNDGVTGRKAIVDYEHGLDPAKGGKAAGEITKTEARTNGLYGLVQFNDIAKKEIEAGEWHYWSSSHREKWTHPQTGKTYEYVLDGGALTNKPYVRGMLPLNFSDVFAVVEDGGATAVLEPPAATDIPPVELSKDINDLIIETVNKTVADKKEEGEVDEFEKQLREALDLDEKVDVLAHVTEMNTELGPLRELKKEHSDKKQFAEMFPAEHKRMAALEESERTNQAKNFSDKFVTARVTRKVGEGDAVENKPTNLGFSALVVEKIKEEAKNFSDGNATFEGFSGILDAILDNGIVEYGTRGSSNEGPEPENSTVPTTAADARKQFSDKVSEIQTADNLEFEAAYAQAAVKYPELHKAYKELKPVAAGV